MLRIIIDGQRDGFSLGYQVEPARFNNKAAEVAGKSMEAIEINKHILHVRGELIRHYNLLKAQGPTITPTMLKNAYQGVHIEKKTLIQVIDYHNAKFKEKVEKEKRSDGTLKKWYTTKDKLVTFLRTVFKMPDVPLERIEYAFAEDSSII